MKHEYKIGGMTCEGCAAKVKSALLMVPQVTSVVVDKATDTSIIEMAEHVSINEFQDALSNIDAKYSIRPLNHSESQEQLKSWLNAYKPILLVFFYLFLVTSLIQYSSGGFDIQIWMRHFMGGFFMIFSFFKMLDLTGFANSYVHYDIIAKRWKTWAFIYAFIELGLGVLYLLNYQPLITNVIAFSVMTISIIGVLQSVLNKRKIQCACLGAVFDLPMSTVTIIEDALMILMSGYMIYQIMI